MSEAAAERPTVVPDRTAGTAGGNFLTRKTGPLPNWAWLGIIGVGGAAVWFFVKSRRASTASSGAGTTTITGNCTDTAGNSVPCDQADYGGQVATLQTEIQDLQGGEVGEGGGGNPPPPAPKPPPASGSTVLTGGHLVSYKNGKAVIGWKIQNPGTATKFRVVLNGPGVKNQVRTIPATATTATFLSLHPGHTYVAEVTPIGANGQAVGGPNHVTFVTR